MKRLTIAYMVFMASFTMAIWNTAVVIGLFVWALFNLPIDAWERAGEIERLAEEGDA